MKNLTTVTELRNAKVDYSKVLTPFQQRFLADVMQLNGKSLLYNNVLKNADFEAKKDILLETFIKAAQNLDKYNSEKSAMGTWLNRIQTNAAYNNRKLKANNTESLDFVGSDGEITENDGILMDNSAMELHNEFVRMDFFKKTYVETELLNENDLFYLENLQMGFYSSEEIALNMDKTPAAVRKIRERIIKKLGLESKMARLNPKFADFAKKNSTLEGTAIKPEELEKLYYSDLAAESTKTGKLTPTERAAMQAEKTAKLAEKQAFADKKRKAAQIKRVMEKYNLK